MVQIIFILVAFRDRHASIRMVNLNLTNFCNFDILHCLFFYLFLNQWLRHSHGPNYLDVLNQSIDILLDLDTFNWRYFSTKD